MNFEALLNDAPRLLAYVICIACLVQLFFIFYLERKDIVIGLKGKDLMWQFLELSGVAWLVLFPTVVIVSLLGVDVPVGAWTSMDAVYFMNLGGKISHKWMDNQATKDKDKAKKDGEV